KQKLARHHADPDSAFWGWNDIWLDPAFKAWNIETELATITCPILAIQGEDDEYGTLAQIERIAHALAQTRLLVLPRCGHSPHRDQPEAVIAAAQQQIV
ncbi:MAG: alpha/beta hydrolase, partial [Betaproteobacteria bacterium]